MYTLKALFTLLRLSCQILRFSAAVFDFGLPTIDLCDKFICEDSDRVTHINDWLAACYARPNQLNLTRTLARTWIFSLATAFSMVEVPFLCEFSTMSSKWNREMGSCDCETGVWKKKRCHQVRSILQPSYSSDLRDKGRSTLTVPRVKQIFFFRDYCCTYDTASHKLPQKGNETHIHTHTHVHTHAHTHTHTHTGLPTATVCL